MEILHILCFLNPTSLWGRQLGSAIWEIEKQCHSFMNIKQTWRSLANMAIL